MDLLEKIVAERFHRAAGKGKNNQAAEQSRYEEGQGKAKEEPGKDAAHGQSG